jgi:lysophospholipase L1-like esterase
VSAAHQDHRQRASGDIISIPRSHKVAYAVVVTLAVLLACEGALRLRAWVRYGSASTVVRDPMLIYDQNAGLYVPKPGFEVRGARLDIRINSLGFRGDEISRAKPPKSLRIACLGASTTFCAEVSSNHATWPHRLQERLQAAYPDIAIQVVNAAVSGYVAADSLKNLRHRVLPLQPDLVIYYEANNEIVSDTRELAMRNGLLASPARSRPVALLSKYSLMFDLGYKNAVILSGRRDVTERKINQIPRDLPNHFISVLDQMADELAQSETPLVLSTFIVKYRREQERRTQIANADVAFYYMPWMSIDGLLDAVDVYNAAILRHATVRHLPVVDERDIIPADPEHFVDCMHLADKGADAMAARYYQFLRQSGLIDRLAEKIKNSSNAP